MPNVGSVSVDVVPSAARFADQLRSQVAPQADQVGQQIGRQLADQIARSIRDGVGDGLRDAPAQSRNSGRQSGDAFAGEFDRTVQGKIRAALNSLPDVSIGVATTEAEQKIRDLHQSLRDLGDQRIGVDISEAEARAKIDEIKVELERLGSESPSVRVKMDTAAAAAQLAALQAIIDKVDSDDVTVDVDVNGAGEAEASLAGVGAAASSAQGGMGGLIAAGIGLAPALIPVAAACVAALAAVGTAAAGAAAGAGVAFAALKPVVGAVQALGAQQTANNPAQAAQQARAQADAIASANAQVQSSEAALANARASAANQNITAVQAITNAQIGLADARRQATAGVASAEQGVTTAEQALATAQGQARNAQLALTDARKAAKQQLEDYKTQLADGALAQRAATLAIAQAKQTLDATNSNPASTDLQRQQAQLAYDQAVQQQTDLGIQQQRLKDNAAAAAKAGVEGSKQVITAQAGVVSANQGVANSQEALGRAQAAVTEARRKGAEQVAKAQQALANAVRAEDQQERQSAASIAAAQAGVSNALRAQQKAHESNGSAGQAAANKVREAFAGLTPAGAEFARFIFGLRDSFGGLSKAAQNGLLPGLQTFIESLLPSLPKVEGFVGKVATAMGNLFVQASKALTGPFWTQFFKFLDRETPKWLTVFAQTVGNIATGLAGLFQALAPVGDILNGSILTGTKAFADWATHLGQDKGFQEFLAYIRASLPQVGQFLGAVVGVGKLLIVALAPLGPIILNIVTQVLKFVASLNPAQFAIIAGAIGVLVAVMTGSIVAIVVAVVGISAALVNLYKTNKTFRDIVNAVWGAVRTAIVSAWEQGIRPAFTALWSFLRDQIFPTVRQLWNDVVKPAFTQIGQIIATTWNVIILPALKGLWVFISQVLAPIILFLLKNVVAPAFKGMGEVITTVWQKVISPALTGLKNAIGGLGGIFRTAVDLVGTVWSKLPDGIKGPIRTVLQFVEDYLIKPLNKMLGAVGVSLRIPDLPLGISGASPNNASSVVSKYDRGGWTGPGGKFQPAGIVHADEFVIRKESQNAIAQKHPGLLDYMNATGRLPGHASGGLVGALGSAASAVGGAVSNIAGKVVDGASLAARVLSDPAGAVRDFISSMVSKLASTPFAQVAGGALTKVGGGVVDRIAAFLGAGGGGTVGAVTNLGAGRVSVAGRILDATTAGIFQKASSILGGLNLLQGSYSTSVGASGGTHAGAGAMDVWPVNGDWKRAVDVLRSLGDVAWHRTPSQGPWAEHIHGITPGIPGLAPSAQGQLASFRAGRNGLASNGPDNHGYSAGGFVKPLLFDSGGYLPTGVSMVRNDTGKPEPLVRADTMAPVQHHWHIQPTDPYAVAAEQARMAAFAGV